MEKLLWWDAFRWTFKAIFDVDNFHYPKNIIKMKKGNT